MAQAEHPGAHGTPGQKDGQGAKGVTEAVAKGCAKGCAEGEMTALLANKLDRLIDLLGRLVPQSVPPPDLTAVDAFVWHAGGAALVPVGRVSHVRLEFLRAIDTMRDQLLENTRRFAAGHAANNALLWGARGMGKSSLVKAVHAHVLQECRARGATALKLIEIQREEIASLPQLLAIVSAAPFPFLIFCDDLSFDERESAYKSLKAVLEGGIEGRPRNVLFYATSNRRHLMPRDMIENERSTAISPAEAVDEKVSLSDRFGLWLGFHQCAQEEYLEIVRIYAQALQLPFAPEVLRARALEWSMTRGARSGRVAFQLIQDLAGEAGIALSEMG